MSNHTTVRRGRPRRRSLWLLGALAALLALPGAAFAAPPNDDYPGIDLGNAGFVPINGTNVDATVQANEPTVFGNIPDNTVWWTWTAPTDAVALVQLCGSDFDTLVGVYTDSNDMLPVETTVAENDDSPEQCLYERASAAGFNTTAGQTYRIAVFGYAGEEGEINGWITTQPPPPNDDWAQRALIGPGLPISVADDNLGATVEPGEPALPALDGGQAGRTVWYSFTPQASQEVRVSTCGGGVDTVVAAFTGGSLASLAEIAGADQGCTSSPGDDGSRFTFQAVAGTEYSIAVGGWSPATYPDAFSQGPFTLQLTAVGGPAPPPPPPNPPANPACDDAQAAIAKAEGKLKKAKKKLKKAKANGAAKAVKKAKRKVKKAKKKLKAAKAAANAACATG